MTEEENVFDRISESLQKENERNEEELQSIMDSSEAKAELAKQIAEDEALAAEDAQNSQEEIANDPELLEALPKQTEDPELDVIEVQSCIEALLFVSEKSISLKKLREYLGPDFSADTFREAMDNIREQYSQPHHGIEIVEVAGGYQFRTKPGRAALAKVLAKVQTQRLSRGAMESLAIIAYRQPVMKDDIDKIRGVDSSHFIRVLMDRGLIHIAGRSDLPGRPILYSTTPHFLEVFGLKDLAALPPLRELESMVPASVAGSDEDPQVKKIREMVEKMHDERETLNYDPREDDRFLAEIRERVKGIAATTQTLEEQDNPPEEEEPTTQEEPQQQLLQEADQTS